MNRTNREKSVDAGIVVLTAVLSLVLAHVQDRIGASLLPQLTSAGPGPSLSRVLPWPFELRQLGEVVAVLACASLWWRQRWPTAVAAITLGASICSPAVAALLVALATLAALCPRRTTVLFTALTVLPVPLYVLIHQSSFLLHPPWDMRLVIDVFTDGMSVANALISCVLLAGAVGAGLFLRTMTERAEQAEAEAVLRLTRAQQQARDDVAREMHDVLAHRLSLLSVQAGALEFHPDASSEDVANAAAVIRKSAHQALEDLQVVLGVLRTPIDPAGGQRTEPPQPTLDSVPALVRESRAAGMRIDLEQDVTASTPPPDITGRTAYRIIQEGLTNARKHGDGERVRVGVRGGPDQGLSVEVHNGVPHAGPRDNIPGTGQGLIGLTERTALAGGRLTHGRYDDNYRLCAWLPWPA